jgi:hypothetical protein
MTMFMRMMVMVTMAVAMVMLVMLTAVRRLDQATLQTGVDQGFYWRVRLPGSHLDAVLGKYSQRTTANAADDDKLDPQALQPAREGARLMVRRGQSLRVEYCLGALIHLDHRELAAAAEMRVQASIFNRNGNLHSAVIVSIAD